MPDCASVGLRHRVRNTRFLLLYLLLAAVVAGDYAVFAESRDDRSPVRIGAIYGFTGVASEWSQQARRGIELARDEVNASGGIHGRQLEILFEDSGTSAQKAVAAFNKLVKIDRVDAVVGDIFSFVTLPLVPLAQRERTTLVTPSIFDTDMPSNSDYLFSTCPRKESIEPPVDKFFQMHRGIRSVAIVCADNTWGRTYLDVWTAVARRYGVKIVDENCISDYTSDMRTEVLRAKAKQPDAIIVAFGIDRALRRMRELRFAPKVLTTSDLDEAIRSRGLSPTEAEGVFFADWLASADFQARFKERFAVPPIMAPQNSYEAVFTIVQALRRSGGDLQESIKALHYTGATGPVDYRGTRAGNRAAATLLRVSGGVIEVVK